MQMGVCLHFVRDNSTHSTEGVIVPYQYVHIVWRDGALLLQGIKEPTKIV